MAIVEITNRSCLSVSGADAKSFLQGLITNDLNKLDQQVGLYSCFLTPQGKFLYDFMITTYNDGYILEVLKDDVESFKKRLKMYALRSDVKLEVLDDFKIYAGWGGNKPETAYDDPRLAELGWRNLSEKTETTIDFKDYDMHRIKLGIPDGSRDLKPEIMTVYDGNIDLLDGIALDKGCYLGQELTARIHYRGLVKKRLFTVKIDVEPEGGIIKTQEGSLAGELLSQQDGWGLALLKLAQFEKPLSGITVVKPDYLSI